MTTAHSSTPTANPFTSEEWQAMRSDDLKAAKAIVGLMIGIFLVGVVLYIGVCVAVM